MFQIIQILTIILVAFAMSPALAHALEFPGKIRAMWATGHAGRLLEVHTSDKQVLASERDPWQF